MKYKVILIFFVISAFKLAAQQESQFTQFMYNKMLINPAYAGSRGVASLTGLYRNQWMGFDGAPKSQLISFDSPFLNDKIGIGVTAFHRTIGSFDNWMGALGYSYALINTDETLVRIGLQASARRYSIRFSDLIEPGIPNVDPSLGTGVDNKIKANVGLGLYFTHREFYIGLSVPNLLTNEIGVNSNSSIPAQERPHLYVMMGGMFPISDDLHIKPAGMLKVTPNAPMSFDANLSFVYKYKLTVGGSYRMGTSGTSDSVDLLTMFQVAKDLSIGAAYDFSLSKLSSYNAGSIEALVRYDIGKGKKKDSENNLSNPRFFF